MELDVGVGVENVGSVVEQRLMVTPQDQMLILGQALMIQLEELLLNEETCFFLGRREVWTCRLGCS